MRGMYILRHNEAVWIILRCLLLRGRLGASVVMHEATDMTPARYMICGRLP